jgi:SAM-dependent methyltransferase
VVSARWQAVIGAVILAALVGWTVLNAVSGAVVEAVRVLRPGGRLVIADLAATGRYCARLRELGMADVERRDLGRRMWWGGPFLPTKLVTATRSG